MKRKCFKCSAPAVWVYDPKYGNDNSFYCDEHVPRGCSCNDQEDPYDDMGREFPCCEYMFESQGFDYE